MSCSNGNGYELLITAGQEKGMACDQVGKRGSRDNYGNYGKDGNAIWWPSLAGEFDRVPPPWLALKCLYLHNSSKYKASIHELGLGHRLQLQCRKCFAMRANSTHCETFLRCSTNGTVST